jgi:hypothetical protein
VLHADLMLGAFLYQVDNVKIASSSIFGELGHLQTKEVFYMKERELAGPSALCAFGNH